MHSWIPADVPKAKAFMQYNLAVCYAMRGEYDKAMQTLAQVFISPASYYGNVAKQFHATGQSYYTLFVLVYSEYWNTTACTSLLSQIIPGPC